MLLEYPTLRTEPLCLRLSTFLLFALLLPSQAYAFGLLPSEISATPLVEWQTITGDSMIVDTNANRGYLVHRDGGFMEFAVATGQRRIVRYIGRTYNARTPNRRWTLMDKEVKSDRTTFGKQGLFLRLYDEDGDTPYGVHTHRSIDTMLAAQDRYRSMGCILVSQSILDIIESTYEGNSHRLEVLTVNGFDDEPLTYETLKQKLAVN